MARPERFELPTPWFVANYSNSHLFKTINNLALATVPLNPDEWLTKPLIGIETRLYYGTEFVFFRPYISHLFTSNEWPLNIEG